MWILLQTCASRHLKILNGLTQSPINQNREIMARAAHLSCRRRPSQINSDLLTKSGSISQMYPPRRTPPEFGGGRTVSPMFRVQGSQVSRDAKLAQ